MALTLLGYLSRGIERIGTAMGELAGWIYLLCAFFITFDIVSRRFFGFSSQGTTEISSYMLAFGITWGLTYTLAVKGHIRVDVLVMRVPLRARAFLHALALAFLVVLSVLLSWRAWSVVLESWEFGTIDPTIFHIPLVIPQGLWAFGITVFSALTVAMLADTLLLLLVGRYAAVDELLGSRAVEQETQEALEAAGVATARPARAAAPQDSPEPDGGMRGRSR